VMSCASAVVDSANDAPNARPMSLSDFMRVPRGGDRYGKCPAGRRVLNRGPIIG
jgi:hypothetical protein